MNWLVIALLSAAITAAVSITDKTIIYKYAKSTLSLLIIMGVLGTINGAVILIISGPPDHPDYMALTAALCSGVLFGFSGAILIKVLFTEEVSRAIPVQQTAPIFTALLALFLLSESISSLQWLGIFGAVLGSALISLNIEAGFGRLLLHRSFYLLVLSALLFGIGNVLVKVALSELSVIHVHGMRMFSMGVIFLLIGLRSQSWKEFKSYFSERNPILPLCMANEFFSANLGLLTLSWALSIGPASLVTAVFATRALFVVIFSIFIASLWHRALGEELSTTNVLVKVFSTILIVAGVVAIAM